MSRQSIQSLTIVRVCPHFKNERGEERKEVADVDCKLLLIFSDTTEPESLLIIPQLSPRLPGTVVEYVAMIIDYSNRSRVSITQEPHMKLPFSLVLFTGKGTTTTYRHIFPHIVVQTI